MKGKERILDKKSKNLNLKKMTKKKSLQEQGITLIALVVTIIILLILAGVTLNMALSQNGLFSKTQEAAEKYKQAQSDEEEEIEKIRYATEGIYITEIKEISSVEEFGEFRNEVNEGNNFENTLIKLTEDIDLNNEKWTPIGKEVCPFSGIFEGNNHKISNLKIEGNADDEKYQGLFGYNKGTIENLGIESGTITVYSTTGAIAGYNGGNIEGCYNNAEITETSEKKVWECRWNCWHKWEKQ